MVPAGFPRTPAPRGSRSQWAERVAAGVGRQSRPDRCMARFSGQHHAHNASCAQRGGVRLEFHSASPPVVTRVLAGHFEYGGVALGHSGQERALASRHLITSVRPGGGVPLSVRRSDLPELAVHGRGDEAAAFAALVRQATVESGRFGFPISDMGTSRTDWSDVISNETPER